MATPSIVQETSAVAAVSKTSESVTFASNVTAGNVLVIAVMKAVSGVRFFTVADNVNGAWTELVKQTDHVQINYFLNAGAGATTVTVTVGDGLSISFDFKCFEISGVDAVDTFGSDSEITNSTTHQCANPKLSASAENFILTASACPYDASFGTITKNVNYTSEYVSVDGTKSLQSRISESALTNQDAEWISSFSRGSLSVMGIFKNSAAGGGTPFLPIFNKKFITNNTLLRS